MSRNKTEIGEIRYNPAEQCFEALVTFHGTTGTRRIPASFRAPLEAEFDAISKGLLQAAMARINRPDQMKSRLEKLPAPAPQPQPSGFDWQALLHGSRAA
ncbi:hypothetical protein [Tropicibacter oceani]|uniref:Uncharacterized protein n=1 Tax=Tropicibacter oceani TaxID=3058420 RepID=A0ABY8QJJ7_9RHOB|nr:hypothetical protein [Tropicibacter oceani]WGW04158.1 hypothetical protein QF118_01075 [Tropicibacter oceani]